MSPVTVEAGANPFLVTGSGALYDPGIIGDGEQLVEALRNKDWVDGGMAAFQAGMDVAVMVSDPFGTLLAAGLGFLMDHLQPLKGWLEELTGDPGAVAAHAATWSGIQQALDDIAQNMSDWAAADLDGMEGQVIDAYLVSIRGTAEVIGAAGEWAGGMAEAEQIATMLVSMVHDLVRDVLSQIVADMIVFVAELVISLGLATPLVIEQCATRVASISGRVGGKLSKLTTSLERLSGKTGELSRLFDRAGTNLDRLASGQAGDLRPHTPKTPEGELVPPGRRPRENQKPPRPGPDHVKPGY